MFYKKFAAILCGIFLIGICGCADNNIAEGEENTWLIEPGIYEENELKTGVLRIDNLPAQSEEDVRTRDAEEAVSTFCEMNDTMSELVDRMNEEEGGVSKEELYDSISRYFDESLTDYVCFLYGMIEKEDQLLHDRNYGRQKFVPDTNEEIILLSETENQCELGVTFKHRWERKWAMEAVPVSLEKRENGWIITGISQWYNDFRYHYMRDEIFTPQSFSQQEAEELVKRFALEENADSLKIHTDKEGWILADSSDRLLTNEDVERLSTFEMHMAIQEIYARHGKKFSDAMLEQYFNRQSWYVPYTMMFYAENLSETEEKNIELLAEAGGFQAEETREYGSLYPCSGQEEDELGEEEVAVIIADAFENARKIVEVKEENYIEEKSEGEQKFYSLGEYSEPAKLREYLSQWFGEESIDYILTCLRISNGLELDENGKYCVSTEYTYAGVWQEFDTFTAVEMIGQDENDCRVKASFINTQVAWVEDAQISSGNIQLAKENDRWIIERMEIPYYDELMIRYA